MALVSKNSKSRKTRTISQLAAPVVLSLLVCTFTMAAPDASAQVKLNGSIKYMRMQEAEADLDGLTRTNKPKWIKGAVYSTGDMVMKVFRRVHFPFFSNKMKGEIPHYKTSSLKIGDRILKYWSGKLKLKDRDNCHVTCVPLKEKGVFSFHHSDPDGPKGYLQCIGTDENGFTQYRVWFSELEGSPSKHSSNTDSMS